MRQGRYLASGVQWGHLELQGRMGSFGLCLEQEETKTKSFSPSHNPCTFSPSCSTGYTVLQYRIYTPTRPLSNLSFLKSNSPIPFSTTTAALAQLGFLQEGEGKGVSALRVSKVRPEITESLKQQWKFREELDPNQGRRTCPAAYIALLSSRGGERLESRQLLLLSVMNSCSRREPKEPPFSLLPSAFLRQAGLH